MKKINIFIAAIILLGFTACKKDFLDMAPTNQGDSETSIKTAADAKVMVNGIMRRMASSAHYGRDFILYGDAKGGDLAVPSQGRGGDALYAFNHSATTGSYSGFWNTMYNTIAQTNNLLEGIENLKKEGSTEALDQYKGQALTARAILYFDLVRLYGKAYTDDKGSFGVPSITSKLAANAQPLRNTVEENYKQIMSDLTTAAPLMIKTKSNGNLNYFANLAMQARVNLYMGNNAAALAAAKEIIDNPLYKLYDNASWAKSWSTQYGTESIFELAIFPSEADLTTGSLSFYLRRKGEGSGSALGNFVASDYFLARLGQDMSDVRWGVMNYDEISNTRMGASYKYAGGTTLLGDGKSTPTAVNIKVIRLSEIYLIAAEAALGTDKELAAGYLNKIRSRAPNLEPATAATITLDMILDERSKELYTEGHRFFDLIRLNKTITFNDEILGITMANRPKTIDRKFSKTILPISQAEINANPGIKAQQNAGY